MDKLETLITGRNDILRGLNNDYFHSEVAIESHSIPPFKYYIRPIVS
jgi:hypothetical protein